MLTLSVLVDDGTVVYLNGTEVVRRGLPEGPLSYSTPASTDIEATTYEEIDLTAFRHLLVQGTNLLAVEVHQSEPSSPDLVWDGGLTYTLASDPSDSDGDGLPADWEAAYGLDDQDPADADLDNDGDGQSNLVEFTAGTSPASGASFFHIESAELSPSGVRLVWQTVPGKTYRVRYSQDLVTWYGFGAAGEVSATEEVSEFTDGTATSISSRYYRIEIIP